MYKGGRDDATEGADREPLPHLRPARTRPSQALDLTEQFYAAALLREVREQEIGGNARMVAEVVFRLSQMDELEEGRQWPGD